MLNLCWILWLHLGRREGPLKTKKTSAWHMILILSILFPRVVSKRLKTYTLNITAGHANVSMAPGQTACAHSAVRLTCWFRGAQLPHQKMVLIDLSHCCWLKYIYHVVQTHILSVHTRIRKRVTYHRREDGQEVTLRAPSTHRFAEAQRASCSYDLYRAVLCPLLPGDWLDGELIL